MNLICGNVFEVLPTLEADSVDACVTDPPYGIGFMGREWDTFKPGTGKHRRLLHARDRAAGKIVSDNPNINGRSSSPAISSSQIDYDYTLTGLRAFQKWTERWATDVFRVLKPGAYIVVCGAPRSYHRMACGLEDAGFVIRDNFAWLFGSGFPKNLDLGDGKGTALKPAHEPIALAWKPFKGRIADCHEKHGTAALNIEACSLGSGGFRGDEPSAKRRYTDAMQPSLGRWPANVLLDDEAARALDEQTGELASGANPTRRNATKFAGVYNLFEGEMECVAARGADAGGASRFYYVAKPSRAERERGTEGLRTRQRDESRKDGNPGGDNPRNRGLQTRGNHHPTVKPIELMRWLVRLVAPVGGTVIDPFLGSGTTGIACVHEAREFIGIDKEPDYIAIAERRIAAVLPLFT